jgi:CheY-like chemotaxis protein
MNIIIVENDSGTIMDLKTILGNLGHEILNLASSGEEAVEKVGDLNPDLISIDLKLKGDMDGAEFAEAIRYL